MLKADIYQCYSQNKQTNDESVADKNRLILFISNSLSFSSDLDNNKMYNDNNKSEEEKKKNKEEGEKERKKKREERKEKDEEESSDRIMKKLFLKSLKELK